ncbi:MAG: DUF1989 domain-containing protein [Hyphomicrobiales bacterium]
MLALQEFRNGHKQQSARRFPGLAAPHPALSHIIAPRQAKCVEVASGDTLALRGLAEQRGVCLVSFTQDGTDGAAALGLQADTRLNLTSFDSAPFKGWVDARGADLSSVKAAWLTTDEDILVLSAKASVSVWIANTIASADLVAGGSCDVVTVMLKKAAPSNMLLPPVLGKIRDEFTISRATAKSYLLAKNEIVQIIDVEGQQCSDFMAFRSAGLDQGKEQMINSTVTRSLVGGAYPLPGLFDKFYDADMRPLLNVVQDTVGRHDTFALACTARGYEERGFPGHVNCSDNISDAVDPYGVQRRSAWPAINFFFNSWIDHADNHIQSEESWSRPGDYVAMRAMDDLMCVSTACPDDIDPINGWNPTDIHVRIYEADTPMSRAIAYREKENAPVSISEPSAFHPRTSALTQHFSPARDLWVPNTFSSVGTLAEYWACRESVTLQDMSGLRKFDVIGPDAERLLQQVMTRDVSKLAVWRGTYSLICDHQGAVIDDGTLFRLAPQLFRWCCGSEESARHMIAVAKDLNFDVRVHRMQGALPNLALQGPRSRDVLRKIVFTQPHVPSLDEVKWFGVTMARLHDREGAPFMLSRSGYTGELGYEVFCDKSDAVTIWDAIMEAGAGFDIKPMGSAALEIIRIEAGLAASNAEFTSGVDAFEAGLGFAVDLRKRDFIGRAALERNAAAPRKALMGLLLDCDDVPSHGAEIFKGERPVGVVTSATRSPTLERAIAMARVAVEHAEVGQVLEIGQMGGHLKRLRATVTDIPFIDPRRERARA